MTDSADNQSGDNEQHNARTISGARWLHHSEDGPVPEGAVRLNQQDISEILWRIVRGWKPKREM